MREKQVFCCLDGIQSGAGQAAASSGDPGAIVDGHGSLPLVPRWWPEAHDQILKFPHGAKDDFVDTLAIIGLGLAKMRPRQRQRPIELPTAGTFRAMFEQTRRKEGRDEHAKHLKGWL